MRYFRIVGFEYLLFTDVYNLFDDLVLYILVFKDK